MKHFKNNNLVALVLILWINIIFCNHIIAQYCASGAGIAGKCEILNFGLGNFNNPSNCLDVATGPGSVLGIYANYTDLTSIDINRAVYTLFSVDIGSCIGNTNNSNAIKVFIDYNRDSIFTSNEEVYVSAFTKATGYTETGTIFIPLSADTGLTLLRIVNQTTLNPANISACGYNGYGETEDYLINIKEPPFCVGIPSINNVAFATPIYSQLCPNTPLILKVNGVTQVTDITIHWDSVAVGAGAITWSAMNLPSAMHLNVITPANLADSVYYRASASCNGGFLVYTPAFCLKSANKPKNCYCNEYLGGSCDSATIVDFQINSFFNNSNNGCNVFNDRIGAYTSFVDSINKLATVNYSVGSNYILSANFSSPVEQAGVYLDKNKNGFFDSTEYYNFVLNASKVIGSITVPSADLINNISDTITMRIRSSNAIFNSSCATFNYGETEDYLLVINNTVNTNAVKSNDHHLILFPNPTLNVLNIHQIKDYNEATTITITNILGQKKYYENVFFGATFEIDVANYSNGIYTLKAVTNNKVKTQNFIINNY